MKSDYIYREACRVKRKFDTRNPFKLAEKMGIHVLLNYDFDNLKGMYTVIQRNRFIFINGNLSERDRITVCAHELGHDRLHRKAAQLKAFQNFMLWCKHQNPENEANIFASHLLIDDNEILSLVNDYDYDSASLACALNVDINYVLIKIEELKKRGYKLKAPYIPKSDFLRGSLT